MDELRIWWARFVGDTRIAADRCCWEAAPPANVSKLADADAGGDVDGEAELLLPVSLEWPSLCCFVPSSSSTSSMEL